MHKIEIIAECGISHNGDMQLAQNMITVAKRMGADVAKFQLYSVDAIFPDKRVMAQGRNWYDEVKKTELTYEQTAWLAAYCKKIGIEFLASCYDLERFAWLEEIGVRGYKVGTRYKSRELIKTIAETGKETLISLERDHVFWRGICKEYFGNRAKYLYCIPKYPTGLADLHLEMIGFTDTSNPNTAYYPFDGFSDHSVGIEASMIAMARGARIIEKHFTLNKNDQSGPDHICSAEPHELKRLVEFARLVEKSL